MSWQSIWDLLWFVVWIWGAVKQEEAEVKYHFYTISLMFPLVPQGHGDLVIYGAVLEEQIRIQLHTNMHMPPSCIPTRVALLSSH